MRRIVSVGAGAALVLGLGLAVPLAAQATTATTVVVTNTDLVPAPATPSPGEFVVINQSGGGGATPVNVFGPGTPPLGLGSLQLNVAGTTDHWSVYNYDHIGTQLSAITALSYSTYTDNTTTAPALQMEINPGAPSAAGAAAGCASGKTYSTLNFEPYLNPGQQSLLAHTWQNWDVLASGDVVWGTGLACTPEANNGVSWSTFLTYYPNATIKYGFGVNVGSGWSAMTGNADALTIGTSATTTTYNFEPSAGDRPFKSSGSGSETSLSAPGCQFVTQTSNGDCTVQSTGTATSSHLGTGPYTSTLTVNWGQAYANPSVTGAYCAPADGSGTLTAASGDTVSQYEYGTVCETGPSSPTVPHTFTGSFYDTGGTGRFSSVTGGGTITGGDDGSGNSNYSESGTIGY